MNIKEYQNLKQKVEKTKQDAIRKQGRYEATLQRIKERYKVDTLEEALELLDTLSQRVSKMEQTLERRMGQFKKEWEEYEHEREKRTT